MNLKYGAAIHPFANMIPNSFTSLSYFLIQNLQIGPLETSVVVVCNNESQHLSASPALSAQLNREA